MFLFRVLLIVAAAFQQGGGEPKLLYLSTLRLESLPFCVEHTSAACGSKHTAGVDLHVCLSHWPLSPWGAYGWVSTLSPPPAPHTVGTEHMVVHADGLELNFR